MARPREFDETAVLDSALGVFWTKGYDGTSIDDLVAATGLGRASLYGAFGDKEKLFARVADHYLAKAAAFDFVKDGLSPREALVDLTSRWLSAACSDAGPRGCFLQQSCLIESTAPLAKELAERAHVEKHKLLERVIRRGQESGDFPRTARPSDLARFLLIVQQGLAVSARAGVPKRQLAAVLRIAQDRVCGSAGDR